MKGKVLVSGLMVLLTLPLFSCGGGSGGGGGGSATYDTVILTAALAVGSPFDSDVAKHTDATLGNCGVLGLDTVTVSPDNPNFTITSTAIAGLPAGVVSSNVRLDSVTLKYTSATLPASPAIPNQNYALSNIIVPGASATVPIRIASQAMKSSLPLSDLVCGIVAGPYSYYVTVTFEGVEILTGQARSFTTTFTINFVDFID